MGGKSTIMGVLFGYDVLYKLWQFKSFTRCNLRLAHFCDKKYFISLSIALGLFLQLKFL